jgi:uncharacterized glyoxalase superfamily protein PhnB
MKTAYIPAGFHSATPYLIFDGSAAKAIEFYVNAFGAIELDGRVTDPAHNKVPRRRNRRISASLRSSAFFCGF